MLLGRAVLLGRVVLVGRAVLLGWAVLLDRESAERLVAAVVGGWVL